MGRHTHLFSIKWFYYYLESLYVVPSKIKTNKYVLEYGIIFLLLKNTTDGTDLREKLEIYNTSSLSRFSS